MTLTEKFGCSSIYELYEKVKIQDSEVQSLLDFLDYEKLTKESKNIRITDQSKLIELIDKISKPKANTLKIIFTDTKNRPIHISDYNPYREDDNTKVLKEGLNAGVFRYFLYKHENFNERQVSELRDFLEKFDIQYCLDTVTFYEDSQYYHCLEDDNRYYLEGDNVIEELVSKDPEDSFATIPQYDEFVKLYTKNELIGLDITNEGEYAKVKDLLKIGLQNDYQEIFGIITYDNENKIIDSKNIFKGSINKVGIDQRILLKEILNTNNLKGILIYHNHPSGDPIASIDDIGLTSKISNIAKELDFELLDHLIVGKERVYSFLDNQEWFLKSRTFKEDKLTEINQNFIPEIKTIETFGIGISSDNDKYEALDNWATALVGEEAYLKMTEQLPSFITNKEWEQKIISLVREHGHYIMPLYGKDGKLSLRDFDNASIVGYIKSGSSVDLTELTREYQQVTNTLRESLDNYKKGENIKLDKNFDDKDEIKIYKFDMPAHYEISITSYDKETATIQAQKDWNEAFGDLDVSGGPILLEVNKNEDYHIDQENLKEYIFVLSANFEVEIEDTDLISAFEQAQNRWDEVYGNTSSFGEPSLYKSEVKENMENKRENITGFEEVKETLQDIMNNDYESYFKALVSIEKGIEDNRLLDKVYEVFMDTDASTNIMNDIDETIEIAKRELENNKENNLVNIVGNLTKDIEVQNINVDGKPLEVANFTLSVNALGKEREYKAFSAYGDKVRDVEGLKKGDFVKIFGKENIKLVNEKEYKTVNVLKSDLLKSVSKEKEETNKNSDKGIEKRGKLVRKGDQER